MRSTRQLTAVGQSDSGFPVVFYLVTQKSAVLKKADDLLSDFALPKSLPTSKRQPLRQCLEVTYACIAMLVPVLPSRSQKYQGRPQVGIKGSMRQNCHALYLKGTGQRVQHVPSRVNIKSELNSYPQNEIYWIRHRKGRNEAYSDEEEVPAVSRCLTSFLLLPVLTFRKVSQTSRPC